MNGFEFILFFLGMVIIGIWGMFLLIGKYNIDIGLDEGKKKTTKKTTPRKTTIKKPQINKPQIKKPKEPKEIKEKKKIN